MPRSYFIPCFVGTGWFLVSVQQTLDLGGAGGEQLWGVRAPPLPLGVL